MANKKLILIGGGIMSATLALLLKKLIPSVDIKIFEMLDKIADESSGAMNNAGTGHSGYCELNYTPYKNNKVDVSKAIEVAHDFLLSKEFWAYAVSNNYISNPKDFISKTPHYSFVDNKNVNFLRKRFIELKKHPLFKDMQFISDFNTIKEWLPLMMNGRNSNHQYAVTKMEEGTDVNFEELTKNLLQNMIERKEISFNLSHKVQELNQNNNKWNLSIKDLKNNKIIQEEADFVFIGAGGGSILLLEKSKIKESLNYGGFPVGGQWLVCDNQEVINQHYAKVYGQAKLNAPPMSVPHLDTRIIDGKKKLLFGPFAVFSTKFLKHGSYLDLFKSIQVSNLGFLSNAGLKNLDLTKYLLQQLSLSKKDKINELKEFMPLVKDEDWYEYNAGQRVQIIKKDKNNGGELKFGTEVVTNSEGTISALLGASPGASTSVSVMLDVIKSSLFKNEINQELLNQILPSLNNIDDTQLLLNKERANKILKLS